MSNQTELTRSKAEMDAAWEAAWEAAAATVAEVADAERKARAAEGEKWGEK